MEPSLGILLERLRWPLPRVRWEAARSIAILVRDDVDGVLDSLVEWISDCELESECLLGLGIVYAFELGDKCPEDAARQAVRKPSLISDWMMRTVYRTIDRSAPFKYTVSIPQSANLSSNEATLFDRYKTVAVPSVFLRTLESLQRELDFPFVDRWHHDWTWICRSFGVREPSVGFFLGSGSGRSGTYQLQIGETLVSAYLRTLAYAIHIGRLRTDDAESYAMLALPMNRGLSRLQPVKQPGWSRNLLRRWRDAGNTMIRDLWRQSEKSTPSGEIPAALLLTEADEEHFIEINIDLVIAREPSTMEEAVAENPKYVWCDTERGALEGRIRLDQSELGTSSFPLTSSCVVVPEYVGRINAEIALNVRLACLGLGSQIGEVCCQEHEVQLLARDEIVSRWYFWYSEWESSRSIEQSTDLSSVTTIQWSRFQRATKSTDMSYRLLVRVRTGERKHIHEDYKVDISELWIKSEDLGIPG